MKILAVDDDDIALDILEHFLLSDGHDVQTATSGEEALGYLSRDEFQMVILDWEMPGMSGIDVCRRIRTDDFGGYIYTILLTSRSTTDEFVEGMAAGADDFVTKPFNSVELRMRIRAGARILSLETRDMLIFTLAKLAESRDPDTGQHLERVQRYSRCLAQHLATKDEFRNQIDTGFIRNIFLTSPLHDIGKVGIPDSILLKQGKLTDVEFELMKSHTVIGAETLREAVAHNPEVGYLRMAYEIALSHHEKFDGSGYPRGVSGEEIPLSARIVAVADVYDALTTKRTYKDEFPHETAMQIICESSGSHFQPELVQAICETEEEFIQIKSAFQGVNSLQFDRLVGV